MKRILLFATSSLLALSTAYSANTLKIWQLDGSEKTEALSVVGKITLTNDAVTLYSTTNEILSTTPITSVRKITFEEGTSTNVKNWSDSKLKVFPNPTQDNILIEGIREGETVRIYSLQGVLLKSVKAELGTTQIPVSDLSVGTYLLQVETDVLKFIKE